MIHQDSQKAIFICRTAVMFIVYGCDGFISRTAGKIVFLVIRRVLLKE